MITTGRRSSRRRTISRICGIAEVGAPVGAVDLPRGVGDLADHQQQMLPHGERDRFVLGRRLLGEGGLEILFHRRAAEFEDMPEEPAEPSRPGLARRQWRRLDDADDGAHRHVGGVVDDRLRAIHGGGDSFPGSGRYFAQFGREEPRANCGGDSLAVGILCAKHVANQIGALTGILPRDEAWSEYPLRHWQDASGDRQRTGVGCRWFVASVTMR